MKYFHKIEKKIENFRFSSVTKLLTLVAFQISFFKIWKIILQEDG